ncbi:MAG: glycosyltransferase family 2 protein [Patescibacteria group bacterium]|jgi:GT2 family glycosyltransferase|nr:glycosyltransferase family 2 protein [Patescibacteria group bacterium]
MKLIISFLCYNEFSAPYLEYFLPSLEQNLQNLNFDYQVIIGDNSEKNDNKQIITNYFQTKTINWQLISFERNLGFAAAYNRLLQIAEKNQVEYFLMLNPDMILESDFLIKLIKGADLNPQYAAFAPKIYQWDFEHKLKTKIIDSCGIILKSGLRFSDLGQGQIDHGQYDKAAITGPSGAAALFRLSALKLIKKSEQYFDERFFMYKEDCDLVYRLNQFGLKSLFLAEVLAYHDRSLTGKGNWLSTYQAWRGRSRQSRIWSFQGQQILFKKYYHQEDFLSRFLIRLQELFFFVFSLFLAKFLFKYNFKRHILD